MASLRRFPDSRYWFARFIGPGGKQVTCSTKEVDKRRAQKIADRFELAARMARLGGLAARQARKVIGEIYEIANREPLPSDTITDYFSRWTEGLPVTHGKRTADRYCGIIRAFLEWLGELGQQRLLIQLGSAELARFRDHYARNHSPASVNTALDCIQSALTDAFQDNLIDTNEAKRVTRIKAAKEGKQEQRRPFSDREIRAILEAATGDYEEWYGMILCGLYQGFRLGDVAETTWLNIDLELAQFRFDTEKTSRAVNVPIAGPLYRYLMELAGDDPTGPLFPKAHALRQRDIPTSALSNQFYRLMARAGVVEKRKNRKKPDGPGRSGKRSSPGLGFHCFRYTATSLLKRAGVSDAVARELIGHESAAVSRLYTNIDTPTLQAALAKMEDFTQRDGEGFPTLRFKFAKTMPGIPHWYVVRSPENETDYVRLFHRIGEAGVWEEWKDGRRYQYYYRDGFKYWRMSDELTESQVINRAKA